MNSTPAVFVVPTYRLRDVAETIEKYDEHFWSNGHSVKMMVFDDSSLANHEKYYSLLEGTRTHNELYYVGPREKEQFVSYLSRRLRDKRLDGLIKNLFRQADAMIAQHFLDLRQDGPIEIAQQHVLAR